MAFAIDGLVSGLQTTSMIDSLMKIEAMPQTLLKGKVSASQSLISAFQGLNTKVAALADLAEKAAKPASLDLFAVTSSSTNATATATSGASAGSIDIVIDELAQAQVSVSEPITAWDSTSITINGTNITAASTSLDDVVAAINGSAAGVQALKVAAGTDVNGDPQYRLQFSSSATGAAGGFAITGTAVPFTEIKAAQDAQVRLWANTPAEQVITSATNTFADLLPGVSVTATVASADPVSITVARDDAQITKVASDLVDSLNAVFSDIATKSAVNTSTDATGVVKTKGGLFTGDSTVRDIASRIITAASAPVSGRSPSEFGISITRSGDMEFDEEKFAAALSADPTATMAAVQEIATRVQDAATVVSDKYDGLLTSKITGQQSLVKDMGDQIIDWDQRLSVRRSSLERTYAALEVALSRMNSQSTWLTGQLASLPTNES